MAKIKEQVSRAKQKLKKFGVGTALAAAAALPLKAGAQTERVVDPETHKLSVVVDTIRLGMTVKNTSSEEKWITFLDYSPARFFLDSKKDSVIDTHNDAHKYKILSEGIDSESIDWIYAPMDNNGLFFTTLKNAIVKKDGNNYEYNTDAIYDNYLNLGKKFFPSLHNKENGNFVIMVFYVGFIEQVVFYDYAQEILFGNMIIDAENRNVIMTQVTYNGTTEKLDTFVYQNIADKENEVRFYHNGDEEVWRKDSKGNIFKRKVIDSKNVEQNVLKEKANQR